MDEDEPASSAAMELLANILATIVEHPRWLAEDWRRLRADANELQKLKEFQAAQYPGKPVNRPPPIEHITLPTPPRAPGWDTPDPLTDAVHFSATAPLALPAGRAFVLGVWAHREKDRTTVLDRARAHAVGRSVGIQSKGPIPIETNSTVVVLLSIPSFGVRHERDHIRWDGSIGNATFPVAVPSDGPMGPHVGTALFLVANQHVARLSFALQVAAGASEVDDVTLAEERVVSAFASYANADRDEVLGRIQGMMKIMPDLDVFLDVMSLRSGDDWEQRISEEITARDVFYLFWSRAAKQSAWVDKEWRTALATKGIAAIDPVPLEPPAVAPPPPELASLHFDEWTLAFFKESQ